MKETRIYVGLNDAYTKEQRFETSRYVDLLKKVCIHYKTPFSVDVQNGGYIHEDGTYTEENSIVLTLLDVPEETVDYIARDLCAFFRQESVLVTTDEVEMRYVREVV